MYDLIRKQGKKTYLPNPPSNWEINETVKKLDFKVIGQFNAKNGKAVVDLQHKNPVLKRLQLAQYANVVTQALFIESAMA
jgi:hypothetical protein